MLPDRGGNRIVDEALNTQNHGRGFVGPVGKLVIRLKFVTSQCLEASVFGRRVHVGEQPGPVADPVGRFSCHHSRVILH